jgi:hypothetical protein
MVRVVDAMRGFAGLHNSAASRLSLHSPTHSVLAPIEDVEPLDSALKSSMRSASVATREAIASIDLRGDVGFDGVGELGLAC